MILDRLSRLFFDINKEYRINFFNKPFNQELIDKISKDKTFDRFIRYIIYEDGLKNLQKSLLNVKIFQINADDLFSLELMP